jgi:PQQ-dependent catabolism-associated CXXCW motif protein
MQRQKSHAVDTYMSQRSALRFLIVAAILAAGFTAWVNASRAQTPDPVSADASVEEPADFRMDKYRTPVPKTLKGAAGVIDADAAKALKDQGAVFIDVYPRAPKPPNLPATTVWREPAHRSIEGALWVPNVGYGLIAPETQRYFDEQLVVLTKFRKAQPVVFFCLRDCWMSWNAAKRAMEMGYTTVYWFPEGSDAWEDSGFPIAVIEPMKPLNGRF